MADGPPTATTALADRPIRARQRSSDPVHVPFVVASLAFGLFGGFALAISLPIEVLAGSVRVSWVAERQVHGHLQVIGFAGLFVVAMALRFAPRFGGAGRLITSRAVRPAMLLLVGGILARAIGQPLADETLFAYILGVGVAAELAGAALVAGLILWALAPAMRGLAPHALLLGAAFVGLVAQAVLGAIWLAGMLSAGGTALPASHAEALTNLQLFGFLLPAILGVGLRTFPTLFGRPQPGRLSGLAISGTLLAGVVVWTVGRSAGGLSARWVLADVGLSLVGIAILGAMLAFGPWRRPSRIAPASSSLRYAFHLALLWLAVTGALLVGSGIRSALAGDYPPAATMDAIRHIFAVGVVTLAIVGMAQLMLPEFASERILRVQSWRGPLFGALLSSAVLLRSVIPLFGVNGDARWWLIAASGVVAWLSVALFAVFVFLASRAHARQLARLASMRA